jgi:hypothetical protein
VIKACINRRSEMTLLATVLATRFASPDHGRPKLAWRKFVACGIVAALLICLPDVASAGGLFDGITGAWSGPGRVTFEGGNSERLTCRAYYTTRGPVLSLAIRCASPSYKTEIRSKLFFSNGSLAGQWEERNFNAVGSASGVLSSNAIVLRISGAIEGRLTINQAGRRQSVHITTNSAGLSSVKIGLSKL